MINKLMGIKTMINYDYLYDKNHYDKFTEVNHFSERELHWRVYPNATILPFANGSTVGMGGLVDESGNYVAGSSLQIGMGETYKYN